MNERIGLKDTTISAIMKLSEGNPGAIRVCTEMLNKSERIDPDSALGGLGALLSLDTHKIYGSRIWMLFKDVCKEDMVKTLAVLRSCQLGFLSDVDFNHAIDNYGAGIDIDDLYTQVKERLHTFNSN